jgi:ABC-2 type transport system permease protein
MFASHFLFELKLRLRSVSTYVYFLIFFLLTFFETSVHDFGPIGTGKVLLNGPYAITLCYVQLTGFGAILIAAIFGPSILRDFQQDTYQLLFTKPISKFDYLGGRWAASLVVTILVLSGLIWGAMVGIFMPWADKTRLAPINGATYFQPFLYIIAQVFILGSLFFCVAALTRRLVVVYLQGVVLFAVYLILFAVVISTNKLDRTWPSFVDPLGFALLDNVTRYWTVAERNTQLIHWSGLFLYNRLTWLGIGLLALAVTYVFFPMSAETLT